MSAKLILALSMFGLAMGVATVFVISSSIEPLFWLVILVVCAAIIAKRAPGKFFLHGLCVGLVNCIWVTGAHVVFFDSYLAAHPKEAQMMVDAPLSGRLMMLVTGPFVGLASGLILGLFAWAAGKLLKRPT